MKVLIFLLKFIIFGWMTVNLDQGKPGLSARAQKKKAMPTIYYAS